MTQKGRNYYAEKGNFIVRKADGKIMGEDICLGASDSIDNYDEQPYTEESYREFYGKTELLESINDNEESTEESPHEFYEETMPEPTPEELLKQAKRQKISEIMKYDQSADVNSFYLGDTPMWLTREERTQIDESINAYEATGETEMTKYFGGVAYTFPLAQWKQMLDALIVYASEALNATESHKTAVLALESIENVEAYDYTVGYPEKLHFNGEP